VIALGVAAGLLSATIFGVGAVVQAHAVRRFDTAPDTLTGFWLRAVRDGRTWAVVIAYLAGFVLHAVAIWLLPLYLAQATVSMSLPVTALASARVAETLDRRHWGAVGVVTLGLVMLSLGAGEPGSVVTSTRFAVALWAGVAVLALCSLGARHLSGSALGALAGLGYAGSAISVRGVGIPIEPLVVVAALGVPAYSVLAFWLYSLGMRRSAVSSTTAALIVMQTFVPAAIGVAFLGDGIRPGWMPIVIAGLVLATAGAISLSRRSLESSATASSPDPARLPPPAPRRSR
jgi:drug/metabolite transporter (DMT)-like permease